MLYELPRRLLAEALGTALLVASISSRRSLDGADLGSDVVLSSLGQGLSLLKFSFRLQPELQIPSRGLSIFLPYFPGPVPNLAFIRMRQSARPVSQLNRQGQDALYRLPVADPSRVIAIFAGLFEKMRDEQFLIHLDMTIEH
jgi:hypothetical protein